MQSRFQHVSLNADLTLGSHHASRRHAPAHVATFLDRNLSRADVHEDAPQNDKQGDEKDEPDNQHRQN